MVGRHRRIRLRAEFRTWRCLASRSRAAASSLAAFAARRRVRVRRVVLAAFTRVVRDARWVDSADRRADRCARRSTWRRAVPRAFATWRLASRARLASKTNATRASPPSRRSTRFARASRRDWRCRPHFAARFARGRVAATFRVARARRFVSPPPTRTKTTRGGGARRKPRGPRRRSRFERRDSSPRMAPTLAFRATRLLAEDGADARVSSDEAPRRRRARWKPGRDGRRKNNEKNSRARNATSPGVARRGTTRVRDRSPGTPGGLVRLRLRKRRRSAVPGNPRRRRG